MAPSRSLTLALAQCNPTLGAVEANADRLRHARAQAHAQGAQVLLTPELALCGYPPEDLVQRPAFLDRCAAEVARLAAETADDGPAMVLGTPWRENGVLYNALVVLDQGAVQAVRYKRHLPNYGVFDEVRLFAPGPYPAPVRVRGVSLGLMVCEDMWFPDVAAHLGAAGAQILVVANGSPYEEDKRRIRLGHARGRVAETGLPLINLNQVGGQDELVFDGASFALHKDGTYALTVASWQEEVALVEAHGTSDHRAWSLCPGPQVPMPGAEADLYRALVMGLRDYVEKNGFPGVLVGLSGGIDSALSAAVAVDALGADRVWCVMMPSPYTSAESLEDAAETARLLGVRLDTVPITPAVEAFDTMLAPLFADRDPDVTEENIQARTRGVILMALSNKVGHMVLTTGNKSEMAVGYATLYGDMCGGFSVLKDVYKTRVQALSRWRNQGLSASHAPRAGSGDGLRGPRGRVMPERVITKPPSAELRPDQKDEDSLPAYAVLDQILHGLIEEDRAPRDLTDRGADLETARAVWRLLRAAEYKRRQAPPGVKVSARAFGRDRRYPITNRFKG